MDLCHHVGLREVEDVAVVAQRLGVVLEALTAELRIGEAALLEHDPHRAVEDHDPLLEQPIEALVDRGGDRHGDS